MVGWLDKVETTLNRINLIPGKTQFSLWALLKGLVIVTARRAAEVDRCRLARRADAGHDCILADIARLDPGRDLPVRPIRAAP
jgi:hypothetical protein